MELLQILGWIYLGVMLGSVFGVMALSLFIGPKIKQYIVDIEDLEEEKRLLKAQISKSYKRGKPQPRKRRNWKKKPTKR
jgi:hypothetical protein|tara:strand:+ start:827 stop:1063 length:237 start_codon:yes stop_codon:yes gene_type:complete